MRKLIISGAVALLLATAGPAWAQMKELTATESVTVTVEAINKSTREVTVRKEDGTHDVLVIPQGIKRFDTLKVGDKIKADYHVSLVLRLKSPSEKPVDQSSASMIKTGASQGTVARERTITATISAIDPDVPSITFTGPNGWKYSSKVQDKEALSKVKVGDKVDITWTEAVALSVEDAK